MIKLLDETFRAAPQSLWATRMRTKAMLGAAHWIGRARFQKVCVAAGVTFEASVKFLKEDPWDRIRQLRRAMPEADLDVLVRSRNLFGWERYPDEVVELLFQCLQRCGVHWVKIFDGLNDFRNVAAHFRIAKALGLKASGLLTYSVSPVHTDGYYVAKGRELRQLGADSITLADASGILTPQRAAGLVKSLVQALGPSVPVELYCHDCMGLALDVYREGALAGANTLVTACEPLAWGDSVPDTLRVANLLDDLGVEVDGESVAKAGDLLRWETWKEGRMPGGQVPFDENQYKKFIGHQIPGGMMSNFRNQLRDAGILHRIDEVLEEAGRVRAELGYPIMVTPFSQFVGVQAVMNIIQGERYKSVPAELALYVSGEYGESPAPVDANVMDRVLRGSGKKSQAFDEVFSAQILKDFRKSAGPFGSDEEMLLALFHGKDVVDAMRRVYRTPEPSIYNPLSDLLRELDKDRNLSRLQIRKGDFSLAIHGVIGGANLG